MKNKNSATPPYYLLTGLLVGLIAGVIISTFFLPAYVDVSPQALTAADRDVYRELIALAYNAEQDIGRAQARLDLLKDKNPSVGLAAQSQQLFSMGSEEKMPQAKAMMQLATFMAQSGATAAALTPTLQTLTPAASESTLETQPEYVLTPSATLDPNSAVKTATPQATFTPTERAQTPLATFTPQVTATPLPALSYPFELEDQNKVCDPQLAGLLQLEVFDQAGNPVPGVRINVTWQGGEDLFYSGLHPNINPGYADFTMQANTNYAVKVGDLSKAVEKITAPTCDKDGGGTYLGGVMLRFNQP
ncbi:MAG: hypothetical protein LWX83_01140 [Anaerolineae bacterium]|nr:hypothetical protein [Anaerolineae bacterium]